MGHSKFHPKVSIVIPVYNGSNYLKEAVDSALSQTYDNVEVIVVNDGSNDNGKTDKICKSYGDRIRYFSKENGGVATALNKGIEEMDGEYFSWLSHDDVYYPNKVEEQIKVLQKIDETLRNKTIIYSNYDLIDAQSKLILTKKFESTHLIRKLNFPLYPVLNGLIHGCSLLIPKNCFNEQGIFDPSLKTTQDYTLWFKIFPLYNVYFEKKVLIKSRFHSEQGSKKISVAQVEAEELWLKFIKNLTEEEMIFIGGSKISFYKNTQKIVEDAGYTMAASYLSNILKKLSNRDIKDLKVSIIIPFFNRQDLVIESLKSVLNQTHNNFEIILVDDFSNSDILKLKLFCKSEKSIRLVKNKYTKGVSGSRNTGIDLAKGKYIAFLDSDDLFKPQKIKNQLNFMVKNNEVFSCTYYETFKNNKVISKIDDIPNYSFPEIIQVCRIATPTVMVHADIFKDKSIRFVDNIIIGEDICLWIDITRMSSCICLNEILTKVRIHDENAAYDLEKQIRGITNILRYSIEKHLSDNSSLQIIELGIALLNLINAHSGIKNPNGVIGWDSLNTNNIVLERKNLKWLLRKFFRMFELFKKQGVQPTLKKFWLKRIKKDKII